MMSPLDAYEGSIEIIAALSVTEADALSDSRWFADHPDRLFRARAGSDGLWLVRRHRQAGDPDVLLRMSAMLTLQTDADGELAVAWFAAANPGRPGDVQKAAQKALNRSSG